MGTLALIAFGVPRQAISAVTGGEGLNSAKVQPVNRTALGLKENEPNVTLPFFVTDRGGALIRKIAPSDLAIRDDGKSPVSPLTIMGPNELPLRLVVLIDASGSELRNPQYRPTVKAAEDFLQSSLTTGRDRGLVVTFAYTQRLSEWMSAAEISRFSPYLDPFGPTELFDAIKAACDAINKFDAGPTRRALVVITDGEDTQSLMSLNAAVNFAEDTRALIFAVDTGAGPDTPHSARKHRGQVFRELAEGTGGASFFEPALGQLPQDFAAIKNQINSILVCTYMAPSSRKPGRHHRISIVAAAGKNWQIHAPDGYDEP